VSLMVIKPDGCDDMEVLDCPTVHFTDEFFHYAHAGMVLNAELVTVTEWPSRAGTVVKMWDPFDKSNFRIWRVTGKWDGPRNAFEAVWPD
jgi:hypothetical protein